MEKQTFEVAVQKTVQFWIQKSFLTPMNQDNGDNEHSGHMSRLLMNTLSMELQMGISKYQIIQFQQKLTQLLIDQKESRNGMGIFLSVDYNPCAILNEAAEFAEIGTSCFPCKTHTKIDSDNVATASYQYRGELKVL